MFEGLTEYAPQTLSPVSGVAIRWESAADDREWTFHLRQDARWSNGRPVTAHDFVRSWRRTLELGERAPHAKLLANLKGAQGKTTTQAVPVPPPANNDRKATNGNSVTPDHDASLETAGSELGIEALNDFTLKVRLQRSDKSFPALVAHPVFRPVYQPEKEKNGAPDEGSDFKRRF
jgi:ABC-type oligopeptide transport system substrate-binding subunit